MDRTSEITIIEPSHGWRLADLRDLVRYREVLAVLCWRDVVVRYKQSAIGIAWAMLQPVMTMIVFSLIFGGLGWRDAQANIAIARKNRRVALGMDIREGKLLARAAPYSSEPPQPWPPS